MNSVSAITDFFSFKISSSEMISGAKSIVFK